MRISGFAQRNLFIIDFIYEGGFILKTKKTLGKRVLSLVLTILIVVSLVPMSAFGTFAAVVDLLATIDTGATVTLTDADGDSYYDIGSADELFAFAAIVNGGNKSINGELTEDIVVNEKVINDSYELIEGDYREWAPIVDFRGKFDGNNYTVSGIYCFSETDKVGLFGSASNNAVISNVGVVDSYFCGKYYNGAVLGEGNNTSIINCYSDSAVNFQLDTGSSAVSYTGGVVGYLLIGKVESCYNLGLVKGGRDTGGVIGKCSSADIANSYNVADISSVENSSTEYVGGITADCNATISNCYNTGSISGEEAGGIVAEAVSGSVVEYCYNTGKIEGGSGIAVSNKGGTIRNCYNTGDIVGTSRIGGIVGIVSSSSTYAGKVIDCYNSGDVTGTRDEVGGIAGYSSDSSTVTNCYNVGTVYTADNFSNLGGVVGRRDNDKLITNCYYLNTACAGGIARSDVQGCAESRTENQFASGEVAYILQGTQTEKIWGQDLETEKTPVLDGKKVYRLTNCIGEYFYSNDTSALIHKFEDSVCLYCSAPCEHKWVDSVCTICGADCSHEWEDGTCTDCTKVCEHGTYEDGKCAICSKPCEHNWKDSVCTICEIACPHEWEDGTCTDCTKECEHEWDYGSCKICGIYCNHPRAKAEYDWSFYSDGTAYASVYLTCKDCDQYADYYGETLEPSSKVEATDCLNPGSNTFTITYEYNGEIFTDSKTVEVKGDNHKGLDANGFCSDCGGYQSAVFNEEDWVYEISNAGQLYWYAQKLNEENAEMSVVLVDDIVIPENAPQWEPISASYVTFDGRYHTISGLKCVNEDYTYVGMFGQEIWWYEIKNLHLTNCYFEGTEYVGALVASMSNGGTIENCYVTNTTVKGESGSVGGLVGYLSASLINCYSTAEVIGEYARPLVGSSYEGYCTIENSYYLADEETKDGGRTLEQFKSGEITYFLQSGILGEDIYDDDWNFIETLVPEIWGQKIGEEDFPVFYSDKVYQITNCNNDYFYSNKNENIDHEWKAPDCTTPKNCPVCGLTEGDALGHVWENSVCTVCNADCEHVSWIDGVCDECGKVCAHEKYENGFCVCDVYEAATLTTDKYDVTGDGEKDEVYEITNAGQLYWFADKVNNENSDFMSANAVLTADIVVNEGTMDADTEGARNWTPIGTPDEGYFGIFDGQGHTISGIYCISDVDCVALVGWLDEDGVVKNLGLINSYFCGERIVAGIAAISHGTVSKCYNSGIVTYKSNNDLYIGGVVGLNNAIVENCYNTGEVSANNSAYTGGVVGVSVYGDITNCYNTGSVSGNQAVGGVVGSNESEMSNCYYLSTCGAEDEYAISKTEEQFKSGEVAYLLGNAFGQKIGVDNAPVFNGEKVYQVTNCENETGYSNKNMDGHIYIDSVCRVCGNTCSHRWYNGVCNYCDLVCSHNWLGDNCSICDMYCYHHELKGNFSWTANADGGYDVAVQFVCAQCTIYFARLTGVASVTEYIEPVDCQHPGSKTYSYSVEYYGETYTDTKTDVVKSDKHVAELENGFCSACNGFEPAVLTTDKYDITGDGVNDEVYEIANAGQLYWFADRINNDYLRFSNANGILVADIVVNEGVMTENSENAREWTPIGNRNNVFYGNFDGNNHTISGLYYNSGTECVGLFGLLYYGTVKNLGVINSYFKGGNYVGAIAGSNCGDIYNCYSTSEVVGVGNVGGIAGDINMGSISDSYNAGKVHGGYQVGGITGYNNGKGIFNCYNLGDVSGESNVCGISGNSGSDISNCFNAGNISGENNVAGIVPGAYHGNYTNCYNVGTISGDSAVSAVVGATYMSTSSNCYYLDTCGAGGTGTSKTLDEFKSGQVAYLLQGEQEDDVWGQIIGTEDYPVIGGKKVYPGYTSCDEYKPLEYTNNQNEYPTQKPEHNIQNDKCSVCGCSFVAKVEAGGVTSHFREIKQAVNFAQNSENPTMTILSDVSLDSYTVFSFLVVVAKDVTLTNKYGYPLNFEKELSGEGTITGAGTTHIISTVSGVTIRNSLSIYSSGVVLSGKYYGRVENYNKISGGEFYGDVFNDGEISGGVFEVRVLNSCCKKATISGGTFNKTVDNVQEDSDFDIYGVINGGVFNGDVNNRGSRIYGGTFNAKINNSSVYALGTSPDSDSPEYRYIYPVIENTQKPSSFTLGENFSVVNDGRCDITCTSHIYKDGVCRICGVIRYEAKVESGDTVEYFTDIYSAVRYARTLNSGTLTILEDITLTDIITSFGNIPVVFEDGVTLNLNGYYMYMYGGVSGAGVIEGDGFVYVLGDTSDITSYSEYRTNYGNILSGTFYGLVENGGTISGGTFNGEVYNDYDENDYGTIIGGTFNGVVKNRHHEYEKSTCSTISGGVFNADVLNEAGKITGGTFNSKIVNSEVTVYVFDYDSPQMYEYQASPVIINTETPSTFTLGDDFEMETEGECDITCTSHIYKEATCRICDEPRELGKLQGYTISLGDKIAVNYHMTLSEYTLSDENAKMVFTVPDSGSTYTVEIPVSEAAKTGDYYVFTCQVAAKEMSSVIEAKLVTSHLQFALEDYSVQQYAEYILEKAEEDNDYSGGIAGGIVGNVPGSNEGGAGGDIDIENDYMGTRANPDSPYVKAAPLVKAMLNYGANAQLYFNYNTDNLANESLSDADKALVSDLDLSAYASTVSGEESGVSFYGGTLSLKSETAIKLYFEIDSSVDVDTLPITVNGENAEVTKNGKYYELKISDIPAHKLQEMYEVKVGGLTVNYGAFSYGNIAMGTDKDVLKNTIKTLYAYNLAALDYLRPDCDTCGNTRTVITVKACDVCYGAGSVDSVLCSECSGEGIKQYVTVCPDCGDNI